MSRNDHRSGVPKRLLSLLALAAVPVFLIFALLSVAGAQGPTPTTVPEVTGEATPAGTATPDASIRTLVRLEVDPQEKPISKGTEFEVRVMVDNVEHLAGFSFTISYDPKRLEAVKEEDSADATADGQDVPSPNGDPAKNRAMGDALTSSPRGGGVSCRQPLIKDNAVSAYCVTLAPPLCLGGPIGASGSGLLGAVYFKSKGGATTVITLADADLTLDDYEICQVQVVGTTGVLPGDCLPFREEAGASAAELSCQPDGTLATVIEPPIQIEGQEWAHLEELGWAQGEYLEVDGTVSTIESRRENVTVELAKVDSNTTMIIVIIVVVLAVGGGGAAGYLWYRRRRAPTGA